MRARAARAHIRRHAARSEKIEMDGRKNDRGNRTPRVTAIGKLPPIDPGLCRRLGRLRRLRRRLRSSPRATRMSVSRDFGVRCVCKKRVGWDVCTLQPV